MRSSDVRAVLWALPALLIACGPAYAISQVPGPIDIGPSWGQTSGSGTSLYTTIVNRGVLADRLARARCSGFGDVTLTGLDRSDQGDNPDQRGVLIPPGATVDLASNGPHFALTDARQPVASGALIPCTLDFVHSGQRIVVFRLGQPGTPVAEP